MPCNRPSPRPGKRRRSRWTPGGNGAKVQEDPPGRKSTSGPQGGQEAKEGHDPRQRPSALSFMCVSSAGASLGPVNTAITDPIPSPPTGRTVGEGPAAQPKVVGVGRQKPSSSWINLKQQRNGSKKLGRAFQWLVQWC